MMTGRTLGAYNVGLVNAVEADLAVVGNLDYLNLDDVADLQHILNLAYAAIGHARDVKQAVFAGGKADKCAEVLDSDNFAIVHFADLGNLNDAQDGSLSGSAALGIGGSDANRAVFLDLDGGVGLVLKATDDLTARADNVADLVGGDMDGLDVGSIRRKLGARSVDGFHHRLHDEGAAFLCLSQSAGKDVDGKALGLVVHLESRDAVLSAANLEVHVAQEVFQALDVGEDDDIVAFLDKAHCDAGDGCLDRHASIHQSQRGTAGGSHGRRAVGFQDLRHNANGVRELFLVGEHRQKSALSQCAVTDFAALRSTHAANLARAVRREVVLMHVALAFGRVDGVEALPLVEHAQRSNGESLGLTTLEQA